MDSLWIDLPIAIPLTPKTFSDRVNHLDVNSAAAHTQRSNSPWEPFDMNYQAHHGANWAVSHGVYYRSDHVRTPQPVPSSRYEAYELRVLQSPKDGKVAVGKEKDRKPLDPPPLIELVVGNSPDSLTYLQSPYSMVLAYLESTSPKGTSEKEAKNMSSNLTGTTASSLHRVKNFDNKDIAAFVFPDLAVKIEGTFRLRFVLMVMEEPLDSDVGAWLTITDCYSDEFTVHNARSFPGMAESTPLTRTFADQGIRLRLRKDSRQLTTKKQNHNTAYRLAGKRPRDATEGRNSDEGITAAPHRRSVATTDRAYFEAPPTFVDGSEAKRQRNASSGHTAYSMRQNIPVSMPFSFSGMTPIASHQSAFFTTSESESPIYAPSYHSREVFGSGMAPMGLPRSGSARLDPQLSSYQGDIFTSPSSQPPTNPYSYAATNETSAPIQHQAQPALEYYQGPEGHLPTLNRAINTGAPHINTSPQGHPEHIHTPVSSTGSPVAGGIYTHEPQFSSNYYDQGTLRTHGISTPVTGDLPPDPLQGSFLPGQMMSVGGSIDFPKTTRGP